MTLMVGRTIQFPEKIQIYHTHVTSALSHVQITRHTEYASGKRLRSSCQTTFYHDLDTIKYKLDTNYFQYSGIISKWRRFICSYFTREEGGDENEWGFWT
jgi:hypothetical protein